ncbi:MAG: hypothetical protein NXH85_11765 [Pseudomonadaceae bacterium]|nr:hypothetical protein [Pseudomonadaceae bacterium]
MTNRGPADWPDDVRRYIHKHFPRRELVSVYQRFASLVEPSDQLLRAVVLLSEGSLSQLSHYVERAADEPGEVIRWAEHDDRVGSQDLRTSNLAKPIDEEHLGS